MKKETSGFIAVIIGNVIFGFSFLFSKLALDITIPSVLIATRFTVAFIILNLIVLFGKMGKHPLSFSLKGKPKKDILLLALFQPIIYFVAENYGIVYTSSSFAGIIIAVIPIVGVVLDVVIMHQKVTKKQVICAICSVLGVALTTVGASDMHSSVKGLIVLLIAVLSGAMFYVMSKKSAAYYNPLERTYVMFGTGSIAYIIFAAIQCFHDYEGLVVNAFATPMFWGSIAYLAVVSSVIAFLLLNYGSNYVSVSKATLLANSTTVISIAAGVLVLHESFTWPQAVGAAIILISVYIAR